MPDAPQLGFEPIPTPTVVPPTIDEDPDAPVFVITRSRWNWAKDQAGKFWPTLKEYWPQITAVLIATGLVSAGVSHVATKATDVPPAPTPVVVPATDMKPVVDAVNALAAEIKKGNADLKTDIASIGKKIDEKPFEPSVDPLVPNASGILPAEVTAKVGRQTVITAKATGDVYWVIPPNTPCDVDTNGFKVTIVPHTDGVFSIGVFTQNKSKWSLTWTMVKAGTAPQPPPPIPVPVPTDPFVKTLQDAYVLDGKPAAALAKLTATYNQAPAIIDNPANKYPIDIVKVNSAAITAQIEPGAPKTVLVNVRTAIDVELRKFLPLGAASEAELTPGVRELFKNNYARVANALKGVQP